VSDHGPRGSRGAKIRAIGEHAKLRNPDERARKCLLGANSLVAKRKLPKKLQMPFPRWVTVRSGDMGYTFGPLQGEQGALEGV
jgi:hypothetical protein